MNNLRIAWRNLWRNRRRTMITVASIFFGVIFSTIMSSMQEGTYSNMIDMMVKLSTGYIQVQHPDYRETKSINNTIAPDEAMYKKITSVDNVTKAVPRLESFALLSSGEKTRGGAVIGIRPSADKATSNLQNWLHKGRFLEDGDMGVLVSYNIADYLDLDVHDTIVMISQGYHGASAAGVYPVKGILKFSTPQLNNMGVFMDITTAQDFFSAYGRVTAIMVMMDNYADVNNAVAALNKKFGDEYNVMNWRELQPELVQFIESDRASATLMKGILYMVIGFGIFGTIIMMMAERKKELGVMIAIGMQKTKLALVMFYETTLIGLIGVFIGFIFSLPITKYFINKPIQLPEDLQEAYLQYGFEPYLFFSMEPTIFIDQVITVFVLTLLISVYPFVKVLNMKTSNALRT